MIIRKGSLRPGRSQELGCSPCIGQSSKAFCFSTLKLGQSCQPSNNDKKEKKGEKRKEKKETLLIGLYDLGSRMLLQMIYFESWFRFSENKLNPLHQRLGCQTQSFPVWKMWLLFNVEISQGYKEGKKLNSFHITKSLWDTGYNALTMSRPPGHVASQKVDQLVWFTPFLNCFLLCLWNSLIVFFTKINRENDFLNIGICRFRQGQERQRKQYR